jgi:Ankyrin repeats (3 copies)
MNRIYRRLRVALSRRDALALTDLVRNHPEAHDGCDRRDAPVAMIASAGLDMLEAAFAAGLSPDAGHRAGDVQTFLQRAAGDGDAETVALCIKYGADLEKRNSRGETALGYACSWGHLPVVRLLVAAGVDVNALEHDSEDDLRNTALDCCSRHPDIAAFLRSVGAKHAADLQAPS